MCVLCDVPFVCADSVRRRACALISDPLNPSGSICKVVMADFGVIRGVPMSGDFFCTLFSIPIAVYRILGNIVGRCVILRSGLEDGN